MRLALLCVLFIAIISPASVAEEYPLKVTVLDLVRHPKRYSGRRVEMTGYWVTSCAHCSDVYPSFDDEQKKPYGRHVALGDLTHATMPKHFYQMLDKHWGYYDGYVHVVGIFRYTPIPDWVGKPISPQPVFSPRKTERAETRSSEAQAERVAVRGWNGPPEKQIVSITLFEPIGPPIPSHIEKYDEEEVQKGLRETERLRRAGKLPP